MERQSADRPSGGQPVWWRAALSVVLGAAGQLLFRRFGMAQAGTDWPALNQPALPAEPGWLLVGIICYVLAVPLWISVLREQALSRAYPLLSLGYPLVLIGAVVWLQESASVTRILGTAIVCVGVWLAVAPPADKNS